MADRVVVIAPPGASGRFIVSLLIDHYKLNDHCVYDSLNNEYLHNASNTEKTQKWNTPDMFWDGSKCEWIEWQDLIDPSIDAINADIISIHNLYDWDDTPTSDGTTRTIPINENDEIYYVDVKDEFEFVLKLVVYKVVTRALFSVDYMSSQTSDVNLDPLKWKEYLRWIKQQGFDLPVMNIVFYRYFYEHPDSLDWSWKELTDRLKRENLVFRAERFDTIINYTLREDQRGDIPKKAKRFTYTDFVEGKTGTILDSYKEQIKKYHEKNLEFIRKFEKLFGSI